MDSVQDRKKELLACQAFFKALREVYKKNDYQPDKSNLFPGIIESITVYKGEKEIEKLYVSPNKK